LEIAVATSSVKSESQASVSAGNGCDGFAEMATVTPHVAPSTRIGTPTPEWKPDSRATRAIVPGSPVKSSIRAARPVRCTVAATLTPSSGQRVPIRNGWSPEAPTTVALPSGSKRNVSISGTSRSRPTSSASAA
jgi:hypothetical protein